MAPSQNEPKIAPATAMAVVRLPSDDCAVTVLRETLASERQRTTRLREELDDVRIALAEAQARTTAALDERDVWAKRTRLLAQVIGDEAEAVRSQCSTIGGHHLPRAVLA